MAAASYDTERGHPLAWLMVITRSRALDQLRRVDPAESHAEPELLAEAIDEDAPRNLLAAVQEHGALHAALAALPAVQRQLLALAFFQGLTHSEIAAHTRLQARGRWIDAALDSMVQSNRLGARCLIEHGATACTDLTGFGLLGHLVEMTRASGVDAEIELSALPVLEGAEETVAAGILSSLQPANVRLRRALRNQEAMVNHPRYALVFDPQTAGGLLAGVPAARADACVAALHALGYASAAAIGRVLPQGDVLEPIVLKE